MSDAPRLPCSRCGAMVLPITIELTGGQCMPCHKGLRQAWEWQEERRASLPVPTWDAARGDLSRVYAHDEDLDWEAEVVPGDVALAVAARFARAQARALPDDVAELAEEAAPLDGPLELLSALGVTIGVDWRAVLVDELALIRAQLASLAIDLKVEPDPDGCTARVQVGGKSADLEYVPARRDDFDAVIDSINRLIAPGASYRRTRSSLGSDTYEYGLLRATEWLALEEEHPNLTETLFRPPP